MPLPLAAVRCTASDSGESALMTRRRGGQKTWKPGSEAEPGFQPLRAVLTQWTQGQHLPGVRPGRNWPMSQAGPTVTLPQRVYRHLVAAFATHSAEWIARAITRNPQHPDAMHPGSAMSAAGAAVIADN